MWVVGVLEVGGRVDVWGAFLFVLWAAACFVLLRLRSGWRGIVGDAAGDGERGREGGL